MITMATEDEPCLMNELPDEILLKIFTKLPLSDLISSRPVCKRWLRLSRDESLWIKVDLSTLFLGADHINKTKNAKSVEVLLSDIQDCVEKLIFNNIPLDGETYELYCQSQNKCLNFLRLKTLDYSYSSVSLCQLRRALSTYSAITELILIHTNILFSDLITEALHLPLLKKLVFHDIHAWENFLDHPQEFARNINSRSLTQVPKHCPNLEWVELYTLWAEFDDSVIQQFIQCCSCLSRLYFTWSTHLTEAAFMNSGKGNSVTHLGLADRQEHGPYLSFVLPHFPNLVSLTMDGYQVYEEDCLTIGKCCPNLQELIFDVKDLRDPMNVFSFAFHESNNFLCASKLQDIALHCPYLRKIHAPCSKVDDESFSFLVRHCPLLEDINFMCCPLLTVKSLHLLSKHSPNIKFINFQYNYDSHDYVLDLVSNCLQLQEVIVDRKMSQSDASNSPYSLLPSSDSFSLLNASDYRRSYQATSPTNHEDVEELPFIDMSTSHEDGSSCQLFELCTASENLSTSPKEDKSTRKAFENAVYIPVMPNHCHISTLSLKDTSLSSLVLQQIFQVCPDLTHVDVDGCVDLKDETIRILAIHCQNLRVLKMSARENSYIGDEALLELCRYSKNLETVSILNNRNISHKGICCILDALGNSLRHLRSLSFCVGPNFSCKMPLPNICWLKYLSKQSMLCLEEATGSRKSSPFRILHLEFLQRKCSQKNCSE